MGPSKTLSISDDMTLDMENPKKFSKKLYKLINEFSKVTEYKSNTQKLAIFLLFKIVIKRIKYWEIHLSKETIALKTTKHYWKKLRFK